MAQDSDVEEKLRSAYKEIKDEVFEAKYIGRRGMTIHLKSEATTRPVYEVISKDFKSKLENIYNNVRRLRANGKEVWKGITGPPQYERYWLWGTEDSECGQCQEYRVMDVRVKPLNYDRYANYCFYVDIKVEKCN